jgi:hypothetical protein
MDVHGLDGNYRSPSSLPFTEEDLVGPDDRPRPDWELLLYEWQGYCNATVKDWLDDMSGAAIRAVQCFVRPDEGVIYVRACAPESPKAHGVTVSPGQRTASFSLFTPLQAFDFPRLNASHKAVFKCRPETFGDVRLLVIEVTGYRVEKVDKDTQEQIAAALSTIPGTK